MRLILVRHGQTDWNLAHRYQGHTDVPLNADGRQQVARLAAELDQQPIDAVFSSDLQRAHETAAILTAARPLTIRPDARLRELHFGAFEGHTYPELRTLYPQAVAAWEQHTAPPPDGESLDQLAARVRSFWDAITNQPPGETVLIVAHGGPLRALVCTALNLPPRQYWQFQIDHASWSEIALYEGAAILTRLNYLCD